MARSNHRSRRKLRNPKISKILASYIFQRENQEFKLKRTFTEMKKQLDSVDKERLRMNITRKEQTILTELKKKTLCASQAIKEGNYVSSSLKLLMKLRNNTWKMNQSTRRSNAWTIETKINKVWSAVGKAELIRPHVIKSYMSHNSDLPVLSDHLIKTRKEGPDMKIRPIVSNKNGTTKKNSWLLCGILIRIRICKLLHAHLESSAHLFQEPHGASVSDFQIRFSNCSWEQ